MPEYDYPEMVQGEDYDQYTFFYHWDTKYIIRIFYNWSNWFKIFVVKENDELFDEIKIENSLGTFPVLLTPNGRYIAYAEIRPEDPLKKVEEGAFYIELRIFELIIDELGKNLILLKTKTIQDIHKMLGLNNQYEFNASNILLSDELDLYYKSETYDYTTYKYNKKCFFNDIEITPLLKGKLG